MSNCELQIALSYQDKYTETKVKFTQAEYIQFPVIHSSSDWSSFKKKYIDQTVSSLPLDVMVSLE